MGRFSMQPKFSIFILSYNRHTLVQHTLLSVLNQSYTNFEVLLVDNGSTPSLANLVAQIPDSRIQFIRYEKNTHSCDVAENVLKHITGTYFLFLADDDALTPNALKIIAGILDSNPNIELLSTGFAHFCHSDNISRDRLDWLDLFSGKLERFDGIQTALAFCNGWGIGERHRFPLPRLAHSSGTFISRDLIKRTVAVQKELFIKPFGDIGYVGCCANTKQVFFLDLPLVIIGETPIREMSGAKPGNRMKWAREIPFLEHTPLKAPSFINMGCDAHLKVMHRNGLSKKYDFRLRPDFYLRHLNAVISDSPWTKNTVTDVRECVPHLIISLVQFATIYQPINITMRLAKKVLSIVRSSIKWHLSASYRESISKNQISRQFAVINEFADWIDKTYVSSKSKVF
jgi:hypothetical protein